MLARLRSAALVFSIAGVGMAWQSAGGNIDLGRRLYREGILATGQPVRATVQNDVVLEGAQVSCANCHRRSGYGSTEGGVAVPPVTASELFRDGNAERAYTFRQQFEEQQTIQFLARLQHGRSRPAYTDDSLARAVRAGKDSAGRVLEPMMPRYELPDEDMRNLTAYLRSLSAAPSPGVTATTIHFATVVAGPVNPDRRRAMLDVLQAYFRRKNADTSRLVLKRGKLSWDKADFAPGYRTWLLHVWELRGDPHTWPSQLVKYYRDQPVFAIVSGMAETEWEPVQNFCEEQQVPCVFPEAEYPTESSGNDYSLYFSRGALLEVQAIADHLRDRHPRVLQVYRDDRRGRTLAAAFRERLATENMQDVAVEPGHRLTPEFWMSLFSRRTQSTLVVWLEAADLQSLVLPGGRESGACELYLSYTQSGEPGLQSSWRRNACLAYPFQLPDVPAPEASRLRGWLQSRRVVSPHEKIQFNTWFTLNLLDYALNCMVERFSRDYLIEIIEQETERSPNPGVYRRLSLGPGQRFASKGCYIVKVGADPGSVEPVSRWIVP